jgi:hypothetical protein
MIEMRYILLVILAAYAVLGVLAFIEIVVSWSGGCFRGPLLVIDGLRKRVSLFGFFVLVLAVPVFAVCSILVLLSIIISGLLGVLVIVFGMLYMLFVEPFIKKWRKSREFCTEQMVGRRDEET